MNSLSHLLDSYRLQCLSPFHIGGGSQHSAVLLWRHQFLQTQQIPGTLRRPYSLLLCADILP